MASKAAKDLLKTVRARYKKATEADQQNRRLARSDLRFVHVPGEQWDPLTRLERGQDRPMYEFNKLRVTIKRIVNDMRANRPAGKVRGTEDADVETAENLEGLIRNICSVSDFDTVVDGAGEYQVGAGMGCWRVSVDYSEDEAWNQDITLKGFKNPFGVWVDPNAQDPMKRDAEYWFVEDRISKPSFTAKYPKADIVPFESDGDDEGEQDWEDGEEDGSIRICEYWWKEPVVKDIVLLSDGRTLDKAEMGPTDLIGPPDPQTGQPTPITVVKEREVRSCKIKTAIVSGNAVLEGPSDWAGHQFPFVMVFGESIVIDGETKWHGLVRFAKDAQRAYNSSRTAAIEAVATASTSKYWATPEQAAGHTEQWAAAHKKNFPFQLYTPDAKAPGPPQRMGPPDIPAALVQEMQIASEDIKAITGIYDASLGNRTNETSGVAIRQRQAQGEIACYNYSDNMGKGIRRTWEILVDLIPEIYDTQREVRILGNDGSEKYTTVNEATPEGVKNDLARGKYDVVVTIGPNFSTARQEATETYSQMAQANPQLMQVAGDLLFKAMDLPYADEIAERWKTILPQPIQQMLQQADGGPPPEVQQAMQQVQQAMQQVQQHGQLVEKAAHEAQAEKADADKAKSDVQLQVAQLKIAEANLATSEAQFRQLIAETQLKMGEGQQSQEIANDRQALEAQIQAVLGSIQEQAAAHQQQALGLIANLHKDLQPQVHIANPPKSKVVRVRRVNGELVGQIDEMPAAPPGAPPPTQQ